MGFWLWQEFSEWAQCQVLEVVSAYRPSSEQEVYDIMNVLDDRLLHSNSAVVMATVKLFLHLTLSLPPTHQQARLTDAPIRHVLQHTKCFSNQESRWQVKAIEQRRATGNPMLCPGA